MAERIPNCVHDVPINEDCRACALDRVREQPSRFQPRIPTTEQVENVVAIRAVYEMLEREIERRCPPGRLRLLAITELEASCMWAVKAITHETVTPGVNQGMVATVPGSGYEAKPR